MSKPWYKSKTKVGGVLIGLSLITGGAGYYLTGEMTSTDAILQAIAGISSILIITGIRDAFNEYMASK